MCSRMLVSRPVQSPAKSDINTDELDPKFRHSYAGSTGLNLLRVRRSATSHHANLYFASGIRISDIENFCLEVTHESTGRYHFAHAFCYSAIGFLLFARCLEAGLEGKIERHSSF
jgi:hypothetical protein